MAGKLPAFQFYPGDWRKDPGLQSLDLAHRGAWIEMLCMMHESQERGVLTINGKPMPTAAIARQLGITADECEAIIGTLLDYGVAMRRPSDGAICSKRMIRDEEARIDRKKKLSDAGRRGAQKKWGGDGVGHPEAISKNEARPCLKNGSSSSSSSSPSGKKNAAHSSPQSPPEGGVSPPNKQQPYTPEFDAWWKTYPARDGCPPGNKRAAFGEWLRLGADRDNTVRQQIYRATRALSAATTIGETKPKDAERFLRPPRGGGDPPYLGWLDASAPKGTAHASPKSHAARSDSYNHTEDTSWLTGESKSA